MSIRESAARMRDVAAKPGMREIAAGMLGLAFGYGGLCLRVRPIGEFFYLAAWGSWLLLADGANRLLYGRSPWSDSPRAFGRLALMSIPWWLFFEVLNLRLRNWAYEGLPGALAVRWTGYAASFATVLPAIEEGRFLIEGLMTHAGTPRLGKTAPPTADPSSQGLPAGRRRGGVRLGRLRVLGGLFLVLPMLWPRLFFPLVWGGVSLLIEPSLAREKPERSWLARFLQGKRSGVYALMASGLLCGFFWELFNFWSWSKWVYTIPWPSGPKLFEMPWLGYAGFAPFALECESFRQWFEWRWARASGPARAAWAAGLAAFSLYAFAAIDGTTARGLPSRQAATTTSEPHLIYTHRLTSTKEEQA